MQADLDGMHFAIYKDKALQFSTSAPEGLEPCATYYAELHSIRTLGMRAAQLRGERLQSEIGELAGISQGNLSRIENGKEVTLDLANRLFKVLGARAVGVAFFDAAITERPLELALQAVGPQDYKGTAGKYIQTVRKRLGLTKEKMADLAETSFTSITRLERDRVLTRISTLQKVSKVLGIRTTMYVVW